MKGRSSGKGRGRGKEPYAVVNNMLVAGIIIDVYSDAAEGGDFGGELIEAGIVLSVLGGQPGGRGGRREEDAYCSRS